MSDAKIVIRTGVGEGEDSMQRTLNVSFILRHRKTRDGFGETGTKETKTLKVGQGDDRREVIEWVGWQWDREQRRSRGVEDGTDRLRKNWQVGETTMTRRRRKLEAVTRAQPHSAFPPQSRPLAKVRHREAGKYRLAGGLAGIFSPHPPPVDVAHFSAWVLQGKE